VDVATLARAIEIATQEGGAYGQNLHPSKDVMVRVSGVMVPVQRVSASFHEGSFVLVIDTDR
jgi:hypothetical protein